MNHVRSREWLDFGDVAVSVGAVPEPAGSGSAGRADHGGCSESIVRENRELDVKHRRNRSAETAHEGYCEEVVARNRELAVVHRRDRSAGVAHGD